MPGGTPALPLFELSFIDGSYYVIQRSDNFSINRHFSILQPVTVTGFFDYEDDRKAANVAMLLQ